MSYRVIVQKGHCYRRSGSTGTSGHRGTEQQFVDRVGDAMVDRFRFYGVTARDVLADEVIPSSTVFVALHQDGSPHPSARGASIGYPPTNNAGRELGQLWKAMYQQAGWPSGFRPDNYTSGLSGYYAWRHTDASAKLLIEHGFATNVHDENWMWDNIDLIAETNCLAIMRFLGINEGDDDMAGLLTTYHDTATDACWVIRDDTAAVRPITNAASWLATWQGPSVAAHNIRFVLRDLGFDIDI